jgi:RES domain-containing protein
VVHDPALLDKLEGLDLEPFAGSVWRHMFNGIDPQLPNTRGARWNPAGTAAVYLSLEADTAVAEADHSLSIQPVRPRPKSRELYKVKISLERVLDLRGPGVLHSLGIDHDALRAYPPDLCQAVGGGAAWLDVDGILVPSARAEGSNLVAFVDHMDPDSALTIIEPLDLPITTS